MSLSELPFAPIRGDLYGWLDLLDKFDGGRPESFAETRDFTIYRYFITKGGASPSDPLVSMMESLHDNSISQALLSYLLGKQRVVAIMGGHKLARSSKAYRDVATLARLLTRADTLLASGGGPGAMEATHLGALLALSEQSYLDQAVALLSTHPTVPNAANIIAKDGTIDSKKVADLHAWLAPAVEIRKRTTNGGTSLAVPTWHYGHEPFSPFATHIAKYFQNSIREDGLLALAANGVVYAEGKAGTIQEIFQDAAQNYYHSFGNRFSPMVFLGIEYWTKKLPVIDLLETLFVSNGKEEEYRQFVLVTDSPEEAATFLMTIPSMQRDLIKGHSSKPHSTK